jgi:uncharacterized protein
MIDAHFALVAQGLDLGMSSRGRLVVVSYTERPPNIRIISCRKATKSERKTYEQAN